MVLLLKLMLFGVVLSLVYGWIFEFIIAKLFKLNIDHGNHFSITTLLGVSLLAGLLGIWSFFARIDLVAVQVFSIIAIMLLIPLWKYAFSRIKAVFGQLISLGMLSWLSLLAFLIYALYLASSSDATRDTGLYHAQSIRWIETYPVVKGIANIHNRLGFNSNLFLLAAFWGSAYKGEHAYQVPGLVIFFAFLVYCLYTIEKARRNFHLNGVMAIGFLIYLLAEMRIIVWFASPTTDLSAAFLSWIIFLFAMQRLDSNNLTQLDLGTIVILVLTLFDISIKLSTAPIVLVFLYCLWQTRLSLSIRTFAGLGLSTVIVIFPWIVRNAIISGYLVFPFYQLDILAVDWKVPYETARQTAETVTSWARMQYEIPSLVMPMKFMQWFPEWYRMLRPADFYLINSILVTLVLLGVFMFLDRQIMEWVRRYVGIYLILFIGVFYWFIEAPSPRFGYGFLITLLFIICSPLIVYVLSRIRISTNTFILLAQIMLILYTINSGLVFPVKSWRHYLHKYKPYPVVTTRSIKINDLTVFFPESGDQCWYDAFPCAPFIPFELSMRGAKIEDGFYIKGK